MVASTKEVKLTTQQQRVLKLLFKFRFVSAQLLAQVMGVSRVNVYGILEYLAKQNLVTKVYKSEYRLHGRPAYYYLNKTGVTTVRKLMEVKESVVHALYKNGQATDDYVQHCLKLIALYNYLLSSLPDGTDIFTKSEINRLSYFPKNRPDLYIRTANDNEAMIVLVDDKAPYIIRKRLDEIITHSEEEGWDSDYPKICFVLADTKSKYSFLYATNKTLDSMGFDEDEISILATSLKDIQNKKRLLWSNAFNPKKYVSMFE